MTASLHKLGCGRDAGAYYTNDQNRRAHPRDRDEHYAAPEGVWWSSASSVVRHAAAIDPESFRDLCAGMHPGNGGRLVRGAGDRHRAGWDLTLSAPKSASVLWASGTGEQRRLVELGHGAAVERVLDFIANEELVSVRLGAGGIRKEPATDLMVGRFAHVSSREGDPNLHTHCVILNVAQCRDGIFRTLEPARLYEWQLVAGAAYRAALAERLAQLGFSFRDAGTGQIEVEGLPEDLLARFSKRALQIRARVSADASAAEKELAALATRSARDEVPYGPALEERWRSEVAAHGIDSWRAARAPAVHAVTGVAQPPPAARNASQLATSGPVGAAAACLFARASLVTRPELLRVSLVEASRRGAGLDAVLAELADLEGAGRLVRLEGAARGEVWTMQAAADREARILREASRAEERDWFRAEAIAAALSAAPPLSDEQEERIREASSRDGVSILEVGSDDEKALLVGTIADAARRSGLAPVGIAPSALGTDALSTAIGGAAPVIAASRAGFGTGARPGITPRSVLVVDDASRLSLAEAESVLAGARACGAKVILLADRRRRDAIEPGSALCAVMDVVERAALAKEIRDQEVAWQRAASELMVDGETSAGLLLYARAGRLALVSGEDASKAAAVGHWSRLRAAHGDDVAILTRRVRDANDLNALARAALRAEGRLSGPDVSLPATDRRGRPSLIALSVGDLVRIGERLPAAGLDVGALARVEGIALEPGGVEAGGDARLELLVEGTRRMRVAWADLVPAPGRGGLDAAPRIDHAYALGPTAARGRTVAASVTYLGGATDAREVLVALTRHRRDATLVAERSRLEAAVRAGQDDQRERPSLSALRRRLLAEAAAPAQRRLVRDHAEPPGAALDVRAAHALGRRGLGAALGRDQARDLVLALARVRDRPRAAEAAPGGGAARPSGTEGHAPGFGAG